MTRAALCLLASIASASGSGISDAMATANRPGPISAQDKQAADMLGYRGYSVNIAELQGEPQKAAILASIRQQIDLIESARIRQQELDFFHGLPILFKDSLRKSPARWNERLGRVELLLKPMDRRPFLMQEMLRAYHARRLPHGFENPTVKAFYHAARKAAQQQGIPLADEHEDHYFLKNERDYFAVTATIYLLGSIDRPPGTRRAIHSQQPDYYGFLGELFGPRDPVDAPPGGKHAAALATFVGRKRLWSRLTQAMKIFHSPRQEDQP